MDDASAPNPSTSFASVTILVVEKDVWVRALISDVLRDQGYTCIETRSAEEALDVLHCNARIDMMLTSLRLSESLDGSALAQKVRAEFPFIKVLMVSAESPDPAVGKMLDAHVRKPFSTAQLIGVVQALVPAVTQQGSP